MLQIQTWVSVLFLFVSQDPYTLKIDVPVVSIDVSVTDGNGVLVNDLSKADFQLFEDGTKQEIRFFISVSAPYSVFLLFDRSESTRKNWTFMRSAVAKFIEGLRPQDRVALGSFDQTYDLHVPWTPNHAAVAEALSKLAVERESNGTRFYAALDRTLRREFKNLTGRRAVVVLTDGKDTDLAFKNDKEFRRVLKSAREQRIPLYVIALTNDGDRSVILAQQYLLDIRQNMEQLAETSGGQILFLKTLEEITPMYETLGRALGTSYSLGYVPSGKPIKGLFRRVEVKTIGRNGLHLSQSRPGYVAK